MAGAHGARTNSGRGGRIGQGYPPPFFMSPPSHTITVSLTSAPQWAGDPITRLQRAIFAYFWALRSKSKSARRDEIHPS